MPELPRSLSNIVDRSSSYKDNRKLPTFKRRNERKGFKTDARPKRKMSPKGMKSLSKNLGNYYCLVNMEERLKITFTLVFCVTLYALSFSWFSGCSLFFCDAIDALSFLHIKLYTWNFVFTNVIEICVLAYASFIALWTWAKLVN